MIKSNFVGTSYGGAEVAANAVATGKDAILFNPASAAFGHYKLDETKYEGNMVSYIIDGEILNSIFKDLDRTPGEKIYLGEEQDPLGDFLDAYKQYILNLRSKNIFENAKEFMNNGPAKLNKSIGLHSLDSFYKKE